MTIPKDLQARLRSQTEEEFRLSPRLSVEEIKEAFRKGDEERARNRRNGYRTKTTKIVSPMVDLHLEFRKLQRRLDLLENPAPFRAPELPEDLVTKLQSLKDPFALPTSILAPVSGYHTAHLLSQLEAYGLEARWLFLSTLDMADLLRESKLGSVLIHPVKGPGKIRGYLNFSYPTWLVHVPELEGKILACTEFLSHHVESHVSR